MKGIKIQRVNKPQSESNYFTIFTATENNNFISKGKKGKTYVGRTEDGWISGQVETNAKTYKPEPNQTKYLKETEAMQAVSSPHGFIIQAEEKRIYPKTNEKEA